LKEEAMATKTRRKYEIGDPVLHLYFGGGVVSGYESGGDVVLVKFHDKQRKLMVETAPLMAADETWYFSHDQQMTGLNSLAGWLRQNLGANAIEIEECLFAFQDRFEDFAEVEHEVKRVSRRVASMPSHVLERAMK
jgi:hypothetical protein